MPPKLTNPIALCALILSVALGASGLLSCASPISEIHVKITRPAEIDLMGKTEIIVAGFEESKAHGSTRKAGRNISQMLEERISESERFRVIDRNNLNTLLKEQRLSSKRLADKDAQLRIGKVLPGAVFLIGEVVEDDYDEEVTYIDDTCSERVKKGEEYEYVDYECRKYTRSGTARVTVNVDVIDAETAQNLKPKNIPCKRYGSTKATDGTPASVDSRSLFDSCYDSIADQVVKAIAPWDESIRVEFRVDKKVPEFQSAVSLIQIGEWDEGISTFKAAWQKLEGSPEDIDPKNLEKLRVMALWNLGLVHKYTHDYESAREFLKKAHGRAPVKESVSIPIPGRLFDGMSIGGKTLSQPQIKRQLDSVDALEESQKKLTRQQSSGR